MNYETIIITILFLSYVSYLKHQHTIIIKDLLNRIMSQDYIQYKTIDKPTPTVNKPTNTPNFL